MPTRTQILREPSFGGSPVKVHRFRAKSARTRSSRKMSPA